MLPSRSLQSITLRLGSRLKIVSLYSSCSLSSFSFNYRISRWVSGASCAIAWGEESLLFLRLRKCSSGECFNFPKSSLLSLHISMLTCCLQAQGQWACQARGSVRGSLASSYWAWGTPSCSILKLAVWWPGWYFLSQSRPSKADRCSEPVLPPLFCAVLRFRPFWACFFGISKNLLYIMDQLGQI